MHLPTNVKYSNSYNKKCGGASLDQQVKPTNTLGGYFPYKPQTLRSLDDKILQVFILKIGRLENKCKRRYECFFNQDMVWLPTFFCYLSERN